MKSHALAVDERRLGMPCALLASMLIVFIIPAPSGAQTLGERKCVLSGQVSSMDVHDEDGFPTLSFGIGPVVECAVSQRLTSDGLVALAWITVVTCQRVLKTHALAMAALSVLANGDRVRDSVVQVGARRPRSMTIRRSLTRTCAGPRPFVATPASCSCVSLSSVAAQVKFVPVGRRCPEWRRSRVDVGCGRHHPVRPSCCRAAQPA
jgi:hypothetical protein